MKLYTKTVCPKCMLVKATLDAAGLRYETINLDHDEEALQIIKDKGFMATPILEVNGDFFATVPDIQKQIAKASAEN